MRSSNQDILGWIDDPPATDRAVYLASATWDWQRCTYAQLAGLTQQMADGLSRVGVRHNDIVVVISPASIQLVAALFGVMLAGGTPAVVAPPRAFQRSFDYHSHLRQVLATAAPRVVLASADLAAELTTAAGPDAPLRTIEDTLLAGASGSPRQRTPRADLALLQFTGGSSGAARGVRVPFTALASNVAAIRRWLDWSAVDAAAFWVPHYHDMGLIGGLITPLASRCALWLLTPEQFIRRPLEYLRCLGQRGARLTAMPAFGLDYITRRVRHADLEGMDFSAVKAVTIGAEPIDPAALGRFVELLEPFGLRPGTLLPAYGLAEATLAVTGVPPGQPWSARAATHGGTRVVGCGPGLWGVEIAIHDQHGQRVPDGELGEIVIRGPSIASGYQAGDSSESLTVFDHDTLRTGDAGFQAHGQLFPIGRLGDSLKIRSLPLFAELLEGELSTLGHPREHNTVLLGIEAGRPIVVWVSERLGPADPTDSVKMLSRVAEAENVVLIRTRRGAIPRTSSGKPRRRTLWNEFVNNRIAGSVTRYAARQD